MGIIEMSGLVWSILYFVAVFGFYEAVLFRNHIHYWQRPLVVTVYFVSATAVLFLFVPEQLSLVWTVRWYELVALGALVVLVSARVVSGAFAYSAVPQVRESVRYVVAKGADIFFQDISVVLVTSALAGLFGTVTGVLVFALYFFVLHLLLFVVLPVRYGIVFVLGALFAGAVFAWLVLFVQTFWSVFVLHALFYVLLYPRIRALRLAHTTL